MPDIDEHDLLLVIAQLAVAFASLASALSDRGRDEGLRVDAGRLVNMLVISLCTAMPAFAPGVIARTRCMKAYSGFKARTNAVNFGLAAVAATSFALSAFGLPASSPSATFIAALVALICICAIVFFRVIASGLGPHAPA
jgi:hypothetical protein